jgi:hypothetical protein
MDILGDLEITRGDSYPIPITIRNKKTKQVVPLTGYTFVMTVDQLENPPDEETQLFQVVGIIDDPDTGVVTFQPTEDDTDLAPRPLTKPYWYEIEYTTATARKTIAKFKLAIKQDLNKTKTP